MRILCFVLAALLTGTAASAQVGGGGTIQGSITDPSGASVSGAAVTATNVATGIQTTRQTTDAGFFALSPLQPGDYSVTVKRRAFKPRFNST